MNQRIRINHQIQAPELRVITDEGENLGVISLKDALSKAEEYGVDLIEISPNATPPIARLMDFGKFQYTESKKQKAARAKSKTTETKSLQIKMGTGDHDLDLKAKKASEWLKEGHRIKIDLFLTGRSKFMDFNFLRQRMDRILHLLTEEYKIADSAKKSPKGLTIVIEKA
ncbi:translation initiation factor IF-3 [Candidatus Parcubacteria bacterium]|nr:translation initiation factor IF-3 [Candidatus Parcubacteria bacterium]